MFFALASAHVATGCSNQQGTSHFSDFSFDSTPEPKRDALPIDETDSGVVVDGAPSDSALADFGAIEGGAAAICPTTFTSPATVVVVYPTSTNSDVLAAITWDELTMAWTTDDGSGVVVHYGDRAGPDMPFASVHTLSASLGPFANDKVALSADGLTMLFMSADHATIHQITRPSHSSEFDVSTVSLTPFRRLTGSEGEGGAMRQVADLVLSKDGKTLYYTDLGRTVGSTINLSLRLADGSWDAPNPLIADRLKIQWGYRRRPTGISSDARTLFYFDEVTNTSAVAFRPSGTALFTDFYSYSPNGQRAMPADACNRVYLTVESDGDADGGVGDGEPPVEHHIAHAP